MGRAKAKAETGRFPEPVRQEVLFISEWEPAGMPGLMRAKPVPLAEKPYRVWTLYGHGHPGKPPELPFSPVHNYNAFIEDFVHDWNWQDGVLRYYSRVVDRPVWILLEYGT